MTRSDDGFTLIEVLVAFMIVALGLTMLYTALAGHSRQTYEADLRERAMAHVLSQLDAIGVSAPLEPGTSRGTYPGGLSWQLSVAPLDGPVLALPRQPEPLRVVLEAFDRSGRRIAVLRSIKLRITQP
jgi:general secretion pathway protein I